eukprot:scaffold447_cov384-Prasinococcus_capsulatus_cf.AAC.3
MPEGPRSVIPFACLPGARAAADERSQGAPRRLTAAWCIPSSCRARCGQKLTRPSRWQAAGLPLALVHLGRQRDWWPGGD